MFKIYNDYLVINMNINISKLSDSEIAGICVKYNIIQSNELHKYTRSQVLSEINTWCIYKKQNYRQRSHSQPNIQQPINNNVKKISTGNTTNGLSRTNSMPTQINKTNSITDPPKPTINRDRRMSEPFTNQEKVEARVDHQNKQQYNQVQNNVKKNYENPDMKTYDEYGMYPPVKRLVAIGDLHGDLRVTLLALRLAKVIPDDIFPYNVQNIRWTGGDTYIYN